jgi:hypothetical protein
MRIHKTFLLIPGLFLSFICFSQNGYTVKQDPLNAKRKIIELKPLVVKAQPMIVSRNVLDDPGYRRTAINFQKFEMKHPKTGKALNPDAVMTIRLPDGSIKKTTVKAFYDELNKMEEAMNARGRSLRQKESFRDLRPNFVVLPYTRSVKLPTGFFTSRFSTRIRPPRPQVGQTVTNSGRPGASEKQNSPVAGNRPVVTNSENTSGGRITTSGQQPPAQINEAMKIEWQPNLYIALRFENHGSAEFPAEWVKSSIISKGRKIFPVVVEIPKGLRGLIKRIDWQVSDKPFDGTLKEANPPGLRKTGTVNDPTWSTGFRGTSNLPGWKTSTYASIHVDLSQVEPEPVNSVKTFFIRTLSYGANGELLKVSPQVIAYYGGQDQVLKIAVPETNSVPGFNVSFPEGDVPFGVYVKGAGFRTKKATKWINNYESLVTTGVSFKADATLGVRHFNFMHFVNSAEPVSAPLNIVDTHFSAIAGLGTGPSGENEPQGVSLVMNFLNGHYTESIELTQTLPNIPNVIPLEYKIPKPFDMQLADARFMIGPIPLRVTANVTGEAGIELSGQVDRGNFSFNGSIIPYINSRFHASGGVDAVIAYATLNSDVNPLLQIDMPVGFSSSGKSLTFKNTMSGLYGRVYLKVGFFYPCPSVEKIVGWITGSEDVPLCECSWEYNIFQWDGFLHEASY